MTADPHTLDGATPLHNNSEATAILSDCLEAMATLVKEGLVVDAVVTDPPYSSGTRREAQKGVRKSMRRETEDIEWFDSDSLTSQGLAYLMRSCALQWLKLVKPGGHVLCFTDWRMYPTMAAAIESADLRSANLLVWDKTMFGMGTHFRNQHELIMHFTKGVGTDAIRRDMPNVLRHPPIRNGAHPTEKPVKLIEELLSVTVPRGGIVLDPFAGSGSTGRAAKNLGIRSVSIERSPEYLKIIRDTLVDGVPPDGGLFSRDAAE